MDYEKYPNFVKAEGYHLILNPGEMLYIPPGNLCILLYLQDLDISFFMWLKLYRSSEINLAIEIFNICENISKVPTGFYIKTIG